MLLALLAAPCFARAQTLPEVMDYLRNPPDAVAGKFLRYYPTHKSVPVEYFEFYLQPNAYYLKKHKLARTDSNIHWRDSHTNDVFTVAYENIHWNYDHYFNELTFYDPNALGTNVLERNPTLTTDATAVMDLDNILNLGVTFVEKGKLEIQGNQFRGVSNNRSTTIPRSISGVFSTNHFGVVDGADLRLLAKDPQFAKPREFHWRLDYRRLRVFPGYPPVPTEIRYTAVHKDGTRKTMEHITIVELIRTNRQPRAFFMPDSLIGAKPRNAYFILADGSEAFTNQAGVVIHKPDSNKYDAYFARRRWVKFWFAITIGLFAVISFVVFLKNNKAKKANN